MTDEEAVEAVLAGDARAFGAIVERHHAACHRFAVHVLGDRADAEDAVQETFVRVYRNLGRYRPREAFRSWLFQILVNRCRSLAGRRRTRRERFVRDDAASANARAVDELARRTVERRLAKALEGLDTSHRVAFLRRVGEEMEYAEISALTGASPATLRMRVLRARDHVRARWGETGHDGG